MSCVGSDRVRRFSNLSRVGSGQVSLFRSDPRDAIGHPTRKKPWIISIWDLDYLDRDVSDVCNGC